MNVLIGPFKQLLTLRNLPEKGPIGDESLEILENAAVLVSEGKISQTGSFEGLVNDADEIREIDRPLVGLPGFIDSHTHMCWGGTRAEDYSLRVSGASYQEILARGGGIHETVDKTRSTAIDVLKSGLKKRVLRHLSDGITTCEVKSGYGLNLEDELKMLQAIKEVSHEVPAEIVSTCLAAHVPPKEFDSNEAYLAFVAGTLLPEITRNNLSHRVDIFIEDNAFTVPQARDYLEKAKHAGFSLTVHADQFSTGGSQLAVELGALSADHLENSSDAEIQLLAASNTVGTVLPGASLGLGMQYAPARKLLDAGVNVSIASDWNPGSAPMGDLLVQAALLGASEKLTTAETFAGITTRAARALGFDDRGALDAGKVADVIAFEADDYREILWHQGRLKPVRVWKSGQEISL